MVCFDSFMSSSSNDNKEEGGDEEEDSLVVDVMLVWLVGWLLALGEFVFCVFVLFCLVRRRIVVVT